MRRRPDSDLSGMSAPGESAHPRRRAARRLSPETQQILAAIPDALVVLEPVRTRSGEVTDFLFAYANHAALATRETTLDEVLGRSVHQVFPHVPADTFARWVRALDTGAAYRNVVEPDVGLLTGAYDVTGVPVDGRLVVTWRDSMDRRRQTAALHDSRARFASSFEASPIGAFLSTVDGRIQELNPALVDMLGGSAADLVGLPIDRLVPESLEESVPEIVASVVRSPGVPRGYDGVYAGPAGRRLLVRVVLTAVPDAEGAAAYLVGHVQNVTDTRVALARLAYTADHDELTGLVNRTRLISRLSTRLEEPEASVALLYVDLDDFKVVNDSLGHGLGDRLLRRVAERFVAVGDPEDLFARFGGDEFVVVPADGSTGHAVKLAAALHEAITAPIVLDGRPFVVGASIGIAIGSAGDRPEALLRDADTAMYEAKRIGRNHTVVFNEALRHRAIARLDGAAALRRALQDGELVLRVQPVVTVADGGMVGAEALIRWQHPDRGLLLPGQFLPLVEEAGLAYDLDRYVLRGALALLAEWQASPVLRELSLSVNVSPTHLLERSYLEEVASLVAEYRVDPSHLSLEITENVLLHNAPAVVEALRSLRELGVRTVVDDFGVGYSSLAYLQDLPVTGLKIDRRFVEGLGTTNDGRLLGAVCGLARAMGMAYVVEGVETDAELSGVIDLDVPVVQGFAYCRPIEPARLEEVARALRGGARDLD